jgi:hypothetical protein
MSQATPVDPPANNMQSIAGPSSERCEPVDKLPGVVTCPPLRRYHLGIVAKWDLLCCLTCGPESRIVNFSTLREHVKKHCPELPKSMTTNKLKSLCRKFNVKEEQVSLSETLLRASLNPA